MVKLAGLDPVENNDTFSVQIRVGVQIEWPCEQMVKLVGSNPMENNDTFSVRI
jgi:hypothetical protein